MPGYMRSTFRGAYPGAAEVVDVLGMFAKREFMRGGADGGGDGGRSSSSGSSGDAYTESAETERPKSKSLIVLDAWVT